MRHIKIFFSGGGSGGHVMTALSIIKDLNNLDYNKEVQFKIEYIGGMASIEKEIITKSKIPYHGIYNGKLRRYFSWDNFKDIFKILAGTIQSYLILKKHSPRETMVFSTGGFVSVPVVISAWLRRIPIFIHEQTSRVGLANKICSYFATKIFVTFEESKKYFPASKTIVSGYPLREECFSRDVLPFKLAGINFPLASSKKIFFATGGGNGSLLINNLIKKNLEWLSKEYFVIHQVGQAFYQEYLQYKNENYQPVEFVDTGMIDLMKLATVVISRAGAGTVCELMAIKKTSIFIPLKIAQKNEQYFNAIEASKKLGSIIVLEDDLEKTNLQDLLLALGKIKQNVIEQKIEIAQKVIVHEILNSMGKE